MKFRNLTMLSLLALIAGCTTAVPVNRGDSEAARWMGIAAEENNAYAQYNYALCCLYGDGVAKDEATGMMYLRLAAANGYAEAVEKLKELENKGKR